MAFYLRFFSSLLILFPLLLHSQVTLDPGSFPAPGLLISNGYSLSPAGTDWTPGAAKSWDFSTVQPVFHDSVRYYQAQFTPWYPWHPGSQTVNAEVAGNIIYVYYLTADAQSSRRTGLTLIGDFGQGWDTVHGQYSDTDTLLSTDYSFGHSETEKAVITIPNILPLANYRITTLRELDADAWGSLQTPLDQYNSVLRVKFREYRYDTAFYLGTPVYTSADTVYGFRFYASGVRHPVVTAFADATFQVQYLTFICVPPVISGCTDSSATNFNPLAAVNDSSCIYCNLTAQLTADTVICPGDSIQLVASGGSIFLWNDGSTASVLTAAPLQSTSWSVFVSDGNGCHASASVYIAVAQPVVADFWTSHTTYNTGDQILFVNTSSEASLYSWDFGDSLSPPSTLPNPLHSYQSSGIKNVTLTASNSCYSDTVSRQIHISDAAYMAETSKDSRYNIFPNPGQDYFIIRFADDPSGIHSVTITDASGRNCAASVRICTEGLITDVSGFGPGIYFIAIRTDERDYFIPWIKSNARP